MTPTSLRFDERLFYCVRVFRGDAEVAQIELTTDDEGDRLYRALMLHNDRVRSYYDLDMAKDWVRAQLDGCLTCGARRMPIWRGQCNECFSAS